MAVAAMLAIVDGNGVIASAAVYRLELPVWRLGCMIDTDVLIVRLMELMHIRHSND